MGQSGPIGGIGEGERTRSLCDLPTVRNPARRAPVRTMMNEKKNVKDQQTQTEAPARKPTLGLRTLVRTETKVRSGCSKATTSSCGTNYRHG